MNYEAQGILIAKLERRKPTDKFTSQEFVVEIPDNNYPQTLKFQAVNGNIDKLDKISEGSEIKVTFNLRGRKWEKDSKTSYFNTLDAWKIELVSDSNIVQDVPFEETPDSDLPF